MVEGSMEESFVILSAAEEREDGWMNEWVDE